MKKFGFVPKSTRESSVPLNSDAPAGQGSRMSPSHDEIAARAFEIFAGRGFQHGQDQQDWLQAERELTQGNAAGLSNPGAAQANQRMDSKPAAKGFAGPTPSAKGGKSMIQGGTSY